MSRYTPRRLDEHTTIHFVIFIQSNGLPKLGRGPVSLKFLQSNEIMVYVVLTVSTILMMQSMTIGLFPKKSLLNMSSTIVIIFCLPFQTFFLHHMVKKTVQYLSKKRGPNCASLPCSILIHRNDSCCLNGDIYHYKNAMDELQFSPYINFVCTPIDFHVWFLCRWIPINEISPKWEFY